jgi:hypothetical protein
VRIDLADLRHGVPAVCARSGRPTTHLRTQWLYEGADASDWWYALFGWGGWVVERFLGGHAIRVALPIAPEVRRRHDLLRLARAALVLVVVLLVSRTHSWTSPTGIAAVAGIAGSLVLRRVARDAWVRPRLRGRALELDAHPAFRRAWEEARAAG